jgi:hypothetical protein
LRSRRGSARPGMHAARHYAAEMLLIPSGMGG